MSVARRALQSGANCSAWPSPPRTTLRCCRSFASSSARRLFETTADEATSSAQPAAPAESDQKRWTHTPERMKAPFSLHQPKKRFNWVVNTDPAKLDRMYEKLVGRDLTRSLPEDLKWLAVTHKSFDNGRRGFNTRLAFFGRMILALETTRTIMGSQMPMEDLPADPHGRTPFEHPALDSVDKLNLMQPHYFASPEKVANLAREVGLLGVVQWIPRLPDNLDGSGVDVVLTSSVFAIIGAISLHYGADVANKVVRERIIKRLS